jgi:hypothetical protein
MLSRFSRVAGQAARSARTSATPSLTSRTTLSAAARANFSIGAKRDYEPIHEKEIPLATYEPGSTVQRTTINVEEAKASEAAAEPVERIVPLTKAKFDAMSPMMQKMTLFGKVVIVTGYVFYTIYEVLKVETNSRHSGARGLGNHMARACIEAGAKAIIIFDANQELGDVSCAELHELTGKTVPIEFAKIDVRDGTAVEEAVKAVVEKYGAPDVVINSAGIAE